MGRSAADSFVNYVNCFHFRSRHAGAASCAFWLYGIGLGHSPQPGGTYRKVSKMRYIDTDAQDMTLSYIDSETMEIAELVASAEGISLEQAIAEELELWEGVTL